MDAPRWLADEPDILALLNAVLDRFDSLSGEARRRSTLIAAQRHLRALDGGGAIADQMWRFIRELERAGVLSVRAARRSVYDAEWQGAKLAFDPRSEELLRAWLQRPAALAPMEEWRRAVQAEAALFSHGVGPLLERRIAVAGRSTAEVVRALAALGEVRTSATLRQLSARAFWGDSKVLDERGELIAALFPQLRIRERPIIVAVHIPAGIQGVLFIENQDTYTAAAGHELPEAEGLALVYLSGFKGTALRIRERTGARVHFTAQHIEMHSRFDAWWFDGRKLCDELSFWGDLDFAGMQMLKTLRQRFGDVRAWRPGYAPMCEALSRSGRGRETAGDSRQTDPGSTGCEYADQELLPLIRRLGFWDQERLATE